MILFLQIQLDVKLVNVDKKPEKERNAIDYCLLKSKLHVCVHTARNLSCHFLSLITAIKTK